MDGNRIWSLCPQAWAGSEGVAYLGNVTKEYNMDSRGMRLPFYHTVVVEISLYLPFIWVIQNELLECHQFLKPPKATHHTIKKDAKDYMEAAVSIVLDPSDSVISQIHVCWCG